MYCKILIKMEERLAISLQHFYEGRIAYNLLFRMFFILELLRVYHLDKYLISNINIVVEVIEGVILTMAIVLFFRNKSKKSNY
ncbi:hypothetical protein FC831_12200 [Clostridium botulinum]|uniref:hypothetical protein n=2 Tax=Clostridium TaxID=1485 RepID=UPI000C23056D|nr:hypothetical protein [Clostridium sp. MIL1]KAI3346000.1 hypothetical protein CIT17_10475 [Clostridium botulinum]MBY6851334.1 hypothetical protein [Clostridium botulinum]NFH01039.1 hypothetical protein [Clostridium botulinum]NFH73195.1 hypothetical protein [Clostridium botulinum]NFI01401.1 hypothetical protein [Clostridium botulinum]